MPVSAPNSTVLYSEESEVTSGCEGRPISVVEADIHRASWWEAHEGSEQGEPALNWLSFQDKIWVIPCVDQKRKDEARSRERGCGARVVRNDPKEVIST